MSIQFLPEYAERMDGAAKVPQNVNEAGNAIVREGFYAASDGVDLALAAVFEHATTLPEALQHLEYIVAELSHARRNIRIAVAAGVQS